MRDLLEKVEWENRKMKFQWYMKREDEILIDKKYFPEKEFILTDKDLYFDGTIYRSINKRGPGVR